MRPGSRTRSGLTVLELLVVISIVLILAGLSFSALKAVRDQAKVTACIANLRHIYGGIAIYSQDHDNRVPSGYADPSAGGFYISGVDLPLMLGDYHVVEQAFRCPLDTPDSRMGFYEAGYGTSYSYSGVVGMRLAETIYDEGHGSTADRMPILTEGYVHLRATANTLYHDGHVSSRRL